MNSEKPSTILTVRKLISKDVFILQLDHHVSCRIWMNQLIVANHMRRRAGARLARVAYYRLRLRSRALLKFSSSLPPYGHSAFGAAAHLVCLGQASSAPARPTASIVRVGLQFGCGAAARWFGSSTGVSGHIQTHKMRR